MARTRILLVGAGAVGARAARQLVESDEVGQVVIVDTDDKRRRAVVASTGDKAKDGGGDGSTLRRVDAVLLASPNGTHVDIAREHLARGRPVVSCADSIGDVQGLLDLGPEARERGVAVVAGAGFSPGLTCLLARHAAADFDMVDEIHVARSGTGGPACARSHHGALKGTALDWRDGGWQRRPAGSGRELCWFPDPIGAEDCYRAKLPDALLLVAAFPGVDRVTARLSATRRDRITARLPMLRKPHPEGLVGAVRVEVRGKRRGAQDVRVLGALDRPAVAAGSVAALAVRTLLRREVPAGAAGLGAVADPLPLLKELAAIGIKAAAFEGGR
ncbi:MAG: Gfo/Idh/MocA family oxidoreductase [Acidimicrobiales bacterium]